MGSGVKNGWLGCVLLPLVAACGGGGDGSAQLTYSPNAPPPPTGATGAVYPAFTFAAPTGGVGPFTWSETGALPEGMSLSPSGQLSGTPQSAGTFPITVTVTDSSSPHQVVTESISLDINDSPLVINTTQPPVGTQFTAYAGFSFTAHGGSAPFAWSVTGGALPAGLTLRSNGELAGTPTGPAGSGSTFTVTVRDSSPSPKSNSAPFAIAINKAAFTITSQSPPSGTDYTVYDGRRVSSCDPVSGYCRCFQGYCFANGFQLTAGYGVPPYSWQWAATTQFGLPPGLNLLSSGLIVGSPTAAGTYGVVVTVTDSSGFAVEATANYTIIITPPSPPQVPPTVSALAIGVNLPFSFTFSATGGQTPLTWSETGALPSGLSLGPVSGVLSGTPVLLGSFPFTVNVQDSAGQNGTPQSLTILVTPHGFGVTGSMSTQRVFHTATLLQDGTVLIVGGYDNFGATYYGGAMTISELYGPGSGAFSPSGALGTARFSHTATLLSTGQVLVTGGQVYPGSPELASAELYDPTKHTFTAVGNMASPRVWHTATLLGNGQVLVAGGANTTGLTLPQATAELFDPSTGSFSSTGSMSTARANHTATLLSTGKVLVTGGGDGSAELYDPATGIWSPTGSMNAARSEHAATLLGNGSVLITGGWGPVAILASAEVYDPKSGSFTTTAGTMTTPRTRHTAALLSDGTVLVAGGLDGGDSPSYAAEIFTPGTGQFAVTGGLQSARSEHTSTVLGGGHVLVTGGSDASLGATPDALSEAEVYQ